jgi:hypothetical protein
MFDITPTVFNVAFNLSISFPNTILKQMVLLPQEKIILTDFCCPFCVLWLYSSQKIVKLFDSPILRAYLIKVIPETRRAH